MKTDTRQPDGEAISDGAMLGLVLELFDGVSRLDSLAERLIADDRPEEAAQVRAASDALLKGYIMITRTARGSGR